MNTRTRSETGAVVVAGIAALGTALLAIAHTGLEIPLLSELGPQGDAVPPAVIAFTVGTLLFGSIAVGVWRGSRAARLVGLVVCALAILSGIGQFRGIVSAIGIVVALLLGGLLLGSRPAPRATG